VSPPGDVVLNKRQVSAFAGSDLGVDLRAGGIDALALGGIATSGCALSILRQAADLDSRGRCSPTAASMTTRSSTESCVKRCLPPKQTC